MRSEKQWADLFRRTAGGAAPALTLPDRSAPEAEKQAFLTGFRDELGHRRLVDRPLLARLLDANPGDPPAGAGGETLLWWAVHHWGLDPWAAVVPEGPLLGLDRDLGIEAWTEAEFAALHAMSWLALDPVRPDRDRLAARLDEAARWHLAETQPDNGTNHPWAIHVFARLAPTEPDAAMYAETMLHSSLIPRGRPDAFSALLLLDAAEWLTG